MGPSPTQRAKELCRAAEKMIGPARERYLREQCGDDEALLAQVEELLDRGNPYSVPSSTGAVRAEVERLLDMTAPMTTLPAAQISSSVVPEVILHYKIEERLGKGGMGIVYRATDLRLNRSVAIKFLPPEIAMDAERRQRFLHEALTASSLNHPNIVTIHGIEQLDGARYLVMEYVRGITLARRLKEGRLSSDEAISIAVQVADAVAAAHAAGIVHRDLKPGNIMVTKEGLVKLLDFGVAKLLGPFTEADAEEGGFTSEGIAVGTLAYMSPEQARGQKVDGRSDIFSFGLVLHEMTTGSHPFSDTGVVAMREILAGEPPRASRIKPGIPVELDRLMRRCLRRNPEDRPQHMAEVKQELEELKALSSPAARRLSWVAAWVTKGVAAAVLVGALGGAGWWWRERRVAPPAPTQLVRLTSDSGLTSYPALSADGKLLCYASDRGSHGNLNIWVQQVGGGDPLRITNDDADDTDPVFSPDGTLVAYHSERRGGGIYVVPALGGMPRLIAPQGRHPRFSPDGAWIAYYFGDVGPGFVTGSAKMYLVTPNGGQRRQVRPEFAMAFAPLWMPDGKHLLFVGRSNAAPLEQSLEWWTTAIDGGPAVRVGALAIFRGQKLAPRPGSTVIVPDAWAPGGRGLLFSARLGDTTNLWEIGISTGGVAEGQARRLTSGTSDDLYATAARNTIAFASHADSVNIWRAGAAVEQLTEGTSFQAYPSVSSDGSKLAYISARSGTWEVWLKDLETGRETQLTRDPVRKYQPKISGDGQHVAYWSWDGQKAGSYMVDSQGEGLEQICEPCGPPTNVSADGRRVLLEPFIGVPSEIMLADMPSRKLSRLVVPDNRRKEIPYAASLSPDGGWVAFHRAISDTTLRRIFVARVPTDGSSIREGDWIPVTDEGQNQQAAWAADGRGLYFLSDRDGFRCIWRQALDATMHAAGPAVAVRHFHQASRSILAVGGSAGAVGLSVVPGGVVFALGDITGNLWELAPESQK